MASRPRSVHSSPLPLPAPTEVLAHPNSRFLYVAADINFIEGYSIDSTSGRLTALSGSPFLAGVGTLAIAIDSSGRFLYSVNQNDSTMSAFRIEPFTGVLTEISGSPFQTCRFPNALKSDPAQGRVYVFCLNQNSVQGYVIDATTGALSSVVGSPFITAGTPFDMAIKSLRHFCLYS
jgi:6-phosphogluconolactonase